MTILDGLVRSCDDYGIQRIIILVGLSVEGMIIVLFKDDNT